MYTYSCDIFYLDINECAEGIDNCDHNCTNTEGSFNCLCRNGYELDSDGHNCSGMYYIYFIFVTIYPNQISMNVFKTLMTVSIIALTLKEGIIVLVMMAILVLEVLVQVFCCMYSIALNNTF